MTAAPPDRTDYQPQPGALALFGLALLFLAVAIYGGLVPYTYKPSPWDEGLARWRQLHWYDELYRGSEYHAFDQVLSKTLLFLPVGALSARPGCPTLPALRAGIALSTVLEVGQLGLPTRYASVTDVLVETTAARLGGYLTRRFLTMLYHPDAPEAAHAYVPAASR